MQNALRVGLEKLGPGFRASICFFCDGEGEYEQTYAVGCGGGYFRMTGRCDHCHGLGLMQGGKPAAYSVRAQVITAADMQPGSP